MANEITEQGEKKVYMKITSPEGKTMGKLDETGASVEVQANGTTTFAAFKAFTYTGAAQEITLEYITTETDFPEGSYQVEIYIDGEVVNTSTFSLR